METWDEQEYEAFSKTRQLEELLNLVELRLLELEIRVSQLETSHKVMVMRGGVHA